MTQETDLESFDFSFDANNLFKEETFSTMEAGSIRRLIPVTQNGEPDGSRAPVFFGALQIMTPQGPIPIQTHLPANNLKEAITVFPEAMKSAVLSLIEEAKQITREKQAQQESRIIVPGRDL